MSLRMDEKGLLAANFEATKFYIKEVHKVDATTEQVAMQMLVNSATGELLRTITQEAAKICPWLENLARGIPVEKLDIPEDPITADPEPEFDWSGIEVVMPGGEPLPTEEKVDCYSKWSDNIVDPGCDLIRWGSNVGYEDYARGGCGPYEMTHAEHGKVRWFNSPTDPCLIEYGNVAFLRWAIDCWGQSKAAVDGYYIAQTKDRGYLLALVCVNEVWLIRPFRGLHLFHEAERLYYALLAEARCRGTLGRAVQTFPRRQEDGIAVVSGPMSHTVPYSVRTKLALEWRKSGKVAYCGSVPMRPSLWWSYLQAINDRMPPRSPQYQGFVENSACAGLKHEKCAWAIGAAHEDVYDAHVNQQRQVEHQSGIRWHPVAGVYSLGDQFLPLRDYLEVEGAKVWHHISGPTQNRLREFMAHKRWETSPQLLAIAMRMQRVHVPVDKNYVQCRRGYFPTPKLIYTLGMPLVNGNLRAEPIYKHVLDSHTKEYWSKKIERQQRLARGVSQGLKPGQYLTLLLALEGAPVRLSQMANKIRSVDTELAFRHLSPASQIELFRYMESFDPEAWEDAECSVDSEWTDQFDTREHQELFDPMSWMFGWKVAVGDVCTCIGMYQQYVHRDRNKEPPSLSCLCKCKRTVIHKSGDRYQLVPLRTRWRTTSTLKTVKPARWDDPLHTEVWHGYPDFGQHRGAYADVVHFLTTDTSRYEAFLAKYANPGAVDNIITAKSSDVFTAYPEYQIWNIGAASRVGCLPLSMVLGTKKMINWQKAKFKSVCVVYFDSYCSVVPITEDGDKCLVTPPGLELHGWDGQEFADPKQSYCCCPYCHETYYKAVICNNPGSIKLMGSFLWSCIKELGYAGPAKCIAHEGEDRYHVEWDAQRKAYVTKMGAMPDDVVMKAAGFIKDVNRND